MSPFDYDLFVIGAGSGGVRAARLSAQMGARVAIAEEYRIGGTCVIRGCVPKKLLVYASHYAELLEDAPGYGWRIDGATFNWRTLIANKDTEIERLSQIYRANLQRAGVEIFETRAVLEGPHQVRLVRQDRSVTAANILIATGAAPFVPDIPGREHVITSNEAFHLAELPESIAIVGGGYIAAEFAGIFHGLGVDVTLIYRGEQILRGFDDDLRNALAAAMQAKGIRLLLKSDVARVDKTAKGLTLTCTSGETANAAMVMYATGRLPNTGRLGLETAGVKTGGMGQIAVDNYSRSSQPHIYAVGDVTNRVNLTPVAIHEAMAFAKTVFGGKPTPVDHSFIPTAVFSQPEIGTVGLTEEKARATVSGQIDIYKTSFRPMKHILPGREERMLMKLVVEAATDKVLGCHILGPDAAEMAQILAIPLRMGATKADFDATMALHPTAAEELVTLREKWQPPAAQAAE